MKFIKTYIPLFIVVTIGVITLATYFIPHRAAQTYLDGMNSWLSIIYSYAILVGFVSLFMTHGKKIAKRVEGWGYSLFMFLGFFLMFIPACFSHGKQSVDGIMTYYGWAYQFLFQPLSATMFSVLAFYIISTVYRSFRVKSAQAFVLFICALILVLGNVPVGQAIWETLLGWTGLHIANLTDWLMSVVSVSAKRGIMIGLAVGGVVTCLKMIFTIERSYLGRDS
ncbi:MAG: hypothetical protein J6Z08_00980 [Elusimicrobiales bacterium]|jgi:hypothetical protein|nr:hypothetical protein [Elusimicrobiales bacterium]